MIDIKDKKDCNGCTACVNVCPVHCISMQTDDEGFLFAKAEEKICISCSLCDKTCPIKNPWEVKEPIEVLAAYNKETELCYKSSSGGIFTLLAEAVIRRHGIIFGARFDDNWQVVIDYTDSIEGLRLFRVSKYVQARIELAFDKVKDFLKAGKLVLYTGTPCQIAGLNHYLKKIYENLITVDVACHGVPSPLLWRRYLGEIKENYLHGEEIKNVNFRYQQNTWKGYRLIIASHNYEYSIPRNENTYLRTFFDGLSIRESCYECKCKEGRNRSDITLADFWGAENVIPDFENDGGLSLVQLHTKKGKAIFPYDAVHFKKSDLSLAKPYNEGLSPTTHRHPKRDVFFQSINECQTVITTIEEIMKPSFVDRIKISVTKVRNIFSRVYHKIR